jgi:predicted RNA-binding Zn ribbon-like protein
MEHWERPVIGGHVSLDFLNTVGWRLGTEVREDLVTFYDWIGWSRHNGLLAPAEAQKAMRWGDRHAARAKAMLARVIGLREAIYRVLRAHVDRGTPPERDLALFNAALREACATLEVRRQESGFVLECEHPDDSRHALWRVIRSTAELLASPELGSVRVCAGEGCGWFFLDRSRNRRRRWCMMSDCGNREKARRYYRRHKSD